MIWLWICLGILVAFLIFIMWCCIRLGDVDEEEEDNFK